MKLFLTFMTSPDVARCRRISPAIGILQLRVSLDPASRSLHISASGPLADSKIGQSIVRALQELAATAEVPAHVTSLPEIPMSLVLR